MSEADITAAGYGLALILLTPFLIVMILAWAFWPRFGKWCLAYLVGNSAFILTGENTLVLAVVWIALIWYAARLIRGRMREKQELKRERQLRLAELERKQAEAERSESAK